MALTANRELEFYTSRELIDLPVADNVRIWKGALVGREPVTGLARPLVAGDEFLGVAYRAADNTIDGHAAGGIAVRLHQAIDVVHALAGVVESDVGREVFASDDETLTFTPLGNSRVGRVVAVEATSVARVRCEPVNMVSGHGANGPVQALPDADVELTREHLNRTLLVSNTSQRTLTLPPVAAAQAGAWVRVVKLSVPPLAVTLDGHAAEMVDGAPTYAGVDARHDCVLLVCTGTEWVVLSRDIAA